MIGFDDSDKPTELEIDLAVCDIMSLRVRKVLKEKGLDPDSFIKSFSSSFWYVPAADRKRYPDGSYDEVPLNRFDKFLDGTLIALPHKEYMMQLESKLVFKEYELCTYLQEDLCKTDFLIGIGTLNEHGKKTSKFHRLKTIQTYQKRIAEQEKARRKAAVESAKREAQRAKEKKDSWLSRLKYLATAKGFWTEES